MMENLYKKITKFGENVTTAKAIKIIFTVGLIVFFNALLNQFAWDDIVLVLQNPDNQSLNIVSHFIDQNNLNGNGYYRPFFTSYLAFSYHFFGDIAFFYHFLQILMHIINTCLLFYLFKSFIDKKNALFASLIFLIHPIQVESTAWISATIIQLSFLFGMLGLIISIKEKITTKNLIFIFILLLLSVFTRETGFLFYPIILLYLFLFKRKYFLKTLLIQLTTLITYAFLRFGIVKIYFEHNNSPIIQQLDIFQRLQNIPAIIFYYIKMIFLPINIAADQLWTIKQIDFLNFYLPLIVDLTFMTILILLGLLLYRYKKPLVKVYLFFLVWLFIGLAIVLQILPLNMIVADRWFYFPLAGLMGMFGICLQAISIKKNLYPKIILLIIVILIPLSFRTILRNSDWYSDSTLKSHDINSESNFDMENNYGLVLLTKKQYHEALLHFKKSIEFYPYENNYLNLGLAYYNLEKFDEANKYLYKAYNATSFARKPHQRLEATYGQIANMQLYTYKNYKEVERISKLGLLDYPKSGDLWLFLALSQYALGNKSDAIEMANKAYTLKPTQNIFYIYNLIINNASLKELGLY